MHILHFLLGDAPAASNEWFWDGTSWMCHYFRFAVHDPVCGLVVTGSIWTTPEGHWWHGVDPWERMAVYNARDVAHRASAIPALIAAYAFPAGVRECILEFTIGT